MSDQRDQHKLKAKWCEAAERYDDMVKEVKALIELSKDAPLDEEERNLLSVAYKNVVGSRRSSHRLVRAKIEEEKKEQNIKMCLEMKSRIEEELQRLCKEVLDLLSDHLLPNPENAKGKIFYLKMKGDYYRYMVEMTEPGDTHDELMKNSDEAYQSAKDVAEAKLAATDPIRLGLALNYSVFFYEIKNDKERACELAKMAFDDAIQDLDNVPENSYKDSTLIMQLLRDNLTLWQAVDGEEDD